MISIHEESLSVESSTSLWPSIHLLCVNFSWWRTDRRRLFYCFRHVEFSDPRREENNTERRRGPCAMELMTTLHCWGLQHIVNATRHITQSKLVCEKCGSRHSTRAPHTGEQHTPHNCALPWANQLGPTDSAQVGTQPSHSISHWWHSKQFFILIILCFVMVIKNRSAHHLFVPCPKISLVSSTEAFDPIPLHPNMIKEKTCLPIANTKWFFNNWISRHE